MPGIYSGANVGATLFLVKQELAKTADYTVLPADVGTMFTNTGATGTVIFTLPAVAVGLVYHFFVVADYTVTVAAATAGDIVFYNDGAANSLSFQTSSQKIGGCLEVFANQAGTKWYVRQYCANTVTVAT